MHADKFVTVCQVCSKIPRHQFLAFFISQNTKLQRKADQQRHFVQRLTDKTNESQDLHMVVRESLATVSASRAFGARSFQILSDSLDQSAARLLPSSPRSALHRSSNTTVIDGAISPLLFSPREKSTPRPVPRIDLQPNESFSSVQ